MKPQSSYKPRISNPFSKANAPLPKLDSIGGLFNLIFLPAGAVVVEADCQATGVELRVRAAH